jgi:hypothetical protein
MNVCCRGWDKLLQVRHMRRADGLELIEEALTCWFDNLSDVGLGRF